jgi:hypothetical protein
MNVSEYQPRFSFRGMIRGDGGAGKERRRVAVVKPATGLSGGEKLRRPPHLARRRHEISHLGFDH